MDIGKKTLVKWANQVSDKTEPQFIAEIEMFEFEGKQVVAVKVPEYPTIESRYSGPKGQR